MPELALAIALIALLCALGRIHSLGVDLRLSRSYFQAGATSDVHYALVQLFYRLKDSEFSEFPDTPEGMCDLVADACSEIDTLRARLDKIRREG
jgi:hypothetical protein